MRYFQKPRVRWSLPEFGSYVASTLCKTSHEQLAQIENLNWQTLRATQPILLLSRWIKGRKIDLLGFILLKSFKQEITFSLILLASQCLDMKSCHDCSMLPGCGWCDDGSGTGLGSCIPGGKDGPFPGSADSSSNCLKSRWNFIDCPGNCRIFSVIQL